MDKFVSWTAAVVVAVVLALVVTAEAAMPVKAVGTLGPRVKVLVEKTGNMLWRNKGTVATGVLLTTFATNPKPFVEGATAVACTAAEKTIDAVLPKVGERIGRSTPMNAGSWLILAGLFIAIGTIVVFRKRFQRKLFVPIVVFLVVFFVICCCGVAVRADSIGVTEAFSEVGAGAGRPGFFRLLLDILFVLLLLIPLGTG